MLESDVPDAAAEARRRSLIARIGGYAQKRSHDPKDTTAAGRAAFHASFEDRVDPERLLPEAERLRRAEAARREHMARLAYRSADARRAKKR